MWRAPLRASTTVAASSVAYAARLEWDESQVCVLERQRAESPLVRVSISDFVEDVTNPRLRLVLFGESHADPSAVVIERFVYDRMTATREDVALGLEFIETDRRDAVRNFLGGEAVAADLFRTPADAERYGPLVHAARASRNDVVAANAPRRLVRQVSHSGVAALASLSAADLDLLPPLPYASTPISEAYDERLRRVGPTEEDRRKNFVAAQCLWDASMAYSLLDHLRAHPAAAVYHVCGRFHIEFFLGIVDHLEHLLDHDPAFSHLSLLRDEFRLVVCVPVDDATFDHQAANDWHDFRHSGVIGALADFVIFTRLSSFESSPEDDDDDCAAALITRSAWNDREDDVTYAA
mmetsp:Transcript_15908/g.49828  ORF Transcript_15908/g.49828 Transcript_15908/m.49828 type:complete len:351 (-) Transcript_15908:555-1607(-)